MMDVQFHHRKRAYRGSSFEASTPCLDDLGWADFCRVFNGMTLLSYMLKEGSC
jgi:hypothetical protein